MPFAAPATPFNEIQKVAPAEIVTIDDQGVRRRRYWRWPIATAPKSQPSIETFDKIFREAVRRQSDVDVPYGVLLSGGLDSSIISAVAKKYSARRIETEDLQDAWWPQLHSFAVGLRWSIIRFEIRCVFMAKSLARVTPG